jgi:hypothetical protein
MNKETVAHFAVLFFIAFCVAAFAIAGYAYLQVLNQY